MFEEQCPSLYSWTSQCAAMVKRLSSFEATGLHLCRCYGPGASRERNLQCTSKSEALVLNQKVVEGRRDRCIGSALAVIQVLYRTVELRPVIGCSAPCLWSSEHVQQRGGLGRKSKLCPRAAGERDVRNLLLNLMQMDGWMDA